MMATSYTLLADLKTGRCSNTAEVCLLRFWEARNFKKGGKLMSVDMLLLDENSTLIQESIGSIRQHGFRTRLSEGAVYTLSGFDVSRSNPNFRLFDAALSIRYLVTLSVSDNTDTASFLGFDIEMSKLTNILALEASHILGIGVDAWVDPELPRFSLSLWRNPTPLRLGLGLYFSYVYLK